MYDQGTVEIANIVLTHLNRKLKGNTLIRPIEFRIKEEEEKLT
jgi:hypothetical protein